MWEKVAGKNIHRVSESKNVMTEEYLYSYILYQRPNKDSQLRNHGSSKND